MWERVKLHEPIHTGVVGSPSFTGTGTDDLTTTDANPRFAASTTYRIQIDSTGETFKWSNDGGGTWEKDSIGILADWKNELVNLEGEKEGITVVFGSAAGHVSGDYWDVVCTGQVVPTSATILSKAICIHGAEQVILKGEYKKGTETGLILYPTFPHSLNTSIPFRAYNGVNQGDGEMLYKPEQMLFNEDRNYEYDILANGNNFVKIYAIREGSTACTGLFTCEIEFHKMIR